MRIRDNVRSMLSTLVGAAGLGVGLTGWGMKAITPVSASLANKGVRAATTAFVVGSGTFAFLYTALPMTVELSNTSLVLHSSLVSDYLFATWTGACAAVSFVLGPPRGGNEQASKKTVKDLASRRF